MHDELGDPHNFNKKVIRIPGGLIYKPRSIYWEEMFLSKKSSFREIFDSRIVFTFQNFFKASQFPDLKFNGHDLPDYSGEVEEFTARKPVEASSELFIKAGILLALSSFYGIGDLHEENILISLDSSNVICSPLDIECVFSFCRLPSQTLLIPSKITSASACGLRDVISLLAFDHEKKLHDISIIVYAYLKTLVLLKESKELTQSLFIKMPSDLPIRVILRNTESYVNFRGSEQLFARGELEQLERGDIPYFYRKIFSNEVKWLSRDTPKIWEGATDLENVDLHQDILNFTDSSLLNNSLPPGYSDLFYAGSLQIVRNLLPAPPNNTEVKFENLKIALTSTDIHLEFGSLDKWCCSY
jgi:lantibiotic modifying enzyme